MHPAPLGAGEVARPVLVDRRLAVLWLPATTDSEAAGGDRRDDRHGEPGADRSSAIVKPIAGRCDRRALAATGWASVAYALKAALL